MEGNRKVYTANTAHPLYPDIHNILRKHLGIDHIIEEVIKKLGQVEQVWLSGELAKGNDCNIIELQIVGTGIVQNYLEQLNNKTVNFINRTIHLSLFIPAAFVGMTSTMNLPTSFFSGNHKASKKPNKSMIPYYDQSKTSLLLSFSVIYVIFMYIAQKHYLHAKQGQ